MPRGRPRKNPLPVVDPYPDVKEFTCSACNFKTDKAALVQKHILQDHYGVARINDNSNTPFTDSERISAYNRAQKALKTLTCPICKKSFKTGLGFKFHLEICGKDKNELLRECEICGKMLKIHSLPHHIRLQHGEEKEEEVAPSPTEALAKKAQTASLGKKRSSAIRALDSFKEYLSDDEQGPAEATAPPAKKGRMSKARRQEEEEFQIKIEDEAEAEEINGDDDEETEEEEGDDENQENELEDDDDAEGLDDEAISAKDLDGLFFGLMEHLKRHQVRPVANRVLEGEFRELEADNGQGENGRTPYKCYNEKCKRSFAYRLDLENHFKKCSTIGFIFCCLAGDSCNFTSTYLNLSVFQHFYQKHGDLVSMDSKVTQALFRPKMRRVSTKKRPSTTAVKKKSTSGGDGVDFSVEQQMELGRNYTKDLIRFLREHGERVTYQCLLAMRNHWKIVLESSVVYCTIVPPFKLSKTMESGDNGCKLVGALHATRSPIDGSFTINVGHYVTGSAWAPLPLPPAPTSGPETFTSLLENQTKVVHQFLAIATTPYEETVLKMTSPAVASLQIWDMGQLVSKDTDVEGTATALLPRIALNINHSYGDLQEIKWCPAGSTFEETIVGPRPQGKMARLGLLALACEDGRLRILAIPQPDELEGSYDHNTRFTVEPVLELEPRYGPDQACLSCIDWSNRWPQDQIIGGYTDGTICLWNLNKLATCGEEECKDHLLKRRQIRPIKVWINGRRCPIVSIRWMNPMLFFTASSDICKVWNVRYDDYFGEYNRNIVQQIEVHPLWYNTCLLLDLSLNRPNNMIIMKSFGNDEPYHLVSSSEASRPHAVANVQRMRLNDMSMSPWMYLVAYGTENGELYTTQVLPKPFMYQKKIFSFPLCTVRLGDLMSILEDVEEGTEAGPSAQVTTTIVKSTPKNKKGLKVKKAIEKLATVKPNQLINEVIDVEHSYEDFFAKYFLIFDEAHKFTLNRAMANVTSSGPSKGTTASKAIGGLNYQTKNDLCRYYALTNVSWNPNLPSYSWLFTATKSGICRLSSYPLVNPARSLHKK